MKKRLALKSYKKSNERWIAPFLYKASKTYLKKKQKKNVLKQLYAWIVQFVNLFQSHEKKTISGPDSGMYV